MILVQDPETGYWNRVKDRPDLVLRSHAHADDCDEFGCDIHNRIYNVDAPLNWRSDLGMMEFICEHGIGHPTQSQILYWLRALPPADVLAEEVHGCDFCCVQEVRVNGGQD